MDVTFAGLTRSTSIIIRIKCKCNNDSGNDRNEFFEEEHVFKSFDDRGAVLRVILDLMEKKNLLSYNNNDVNHPSSRSSHHHNQTLIGDSTTMRNNTSNISHRMDRKISSDISFSSDAPVKKSLRLRTYSDPARNNNLDGNTRTNTCTSIPMPNRMRGESTPDWRKNGNSNETLGQNVATSNTVLESKLPIITTIDSVKESFASSYPELVTDSYILDGYSLDQMFSTFLADNAMKSLKHFQETTLKARNFDITNWAPMDMNFQYIPEKENFTKQSRYISYLHPRTAKLGPSIAQVSRQQFCTIFPSHSGIVLDIATKLDGVPYADCFIVEEKWIIEHCPSGVQFSIRFNINFVKPTMMKKIIEKQTKQEVKTWYKMYLQYLSSEENGEFISMEDEKEGGDKRTFFRDLISSPPIFTLLCIPMFVYFAFQIHLLHAKISFMEDIIIDLQNENACQTSCVV